MSPTQTFLFPMAILGVEEPWAAGQGSLGVMISPTSAKSPELGWGRRTPCSVDLLQDQRHDHMSEGCGQLSQAGPEPHLSAQQEPTCLLSTCPALAPPSGPGELQSQSPRGTGSR